MPRVNAVVKIIAKKKGWGVVAAAELAYLEQKAAAAIRRCLSFSQSPAVFPSALSRLRLISV